MGEGMCGDLGVAARDEEVNQLLQEVQEEALLPTLASTTNHIESGTSTWYKGDHPLCRRPLLSVQADVRGWDGIESGSLGASTY